MALVNRITRLFRADLHSVLDCIEEPETLLKQAVREMQDDISNDERRLLLLEHEETQLSRQSRDLKLATARLESELDICFESNEYELARNLVRRKLEAQSYQAALDAKTETLAATLVQLKRRLDENHTRLSAMQQKLELLVDESTSTNTLSQGACDTDSRGDYNSPSLRPISDDEVEIAFLGEKQQRMQS